jgi:hypothetical protein
MFEDKPKALQFHSKNEAKKFLGLKENQNEEDFGIYFEEVE